MTREDQRGPRCRNSWRPSDGPLSPHAEDLRRRRPPVPPDLTALSYTVRAPHPSSRTSPEYDQRLTPATTQATPEPPPQAFKNPNLIPVVPRRYQIFSDMRGLQQQEEPEEERLPQIWHTSVDDLIRRTAHDYDLIMNYERDAEGGQRWLPEDISRIRDVGKNLHRDIFALRRWQRVVAEQGDQDKNMMKQIKREANFLKLLCERVQNAINKYEQKCELELLRDGVYAQDEDGNIYKPTAPQQFVAEDDYLQGVPWPSIESTEDDGLNRLYGHEQDSHQESYRNIPNTRRFRTPPDARTSSPPKRNPAFDFTFQTTPLDKTKAEAAWQSPSRRSNRVLDGRISKSHRDPPFARKPRTPFPAHHTRSPDPVTHSAQPTSDKRPRARGRNNRSERDGRSRRQAKRDRARERSPRPSAGRLGKHVLHY